MLIFLIILSLLSPPHTNAATQQATQADFKALPLPSSVEKLAFGSCSKQSLPQKLWPTIANEQPSAFLWLGDMVYPGGSSVSNLEKALTRQSGLKPFQNFRQAVPIIGIWDDHDFDEEFEDRRAKNKTQRQNAILRFLGESPNSPRWKRKGLYHRYQFQTASGPVQLHLLDTRSQKSPWEEKGGSILGPEQWAWLSNNLKASPSGIHIIASSMQVLSDRHPFDHWGRFPTERQRLLKLLGSSGVQSPIILSGDRHIAELSYISEKQSGVSGGVWELTSSGMTHAYTNFSGEENPYRVGRVYSQINYGTLSFEPKGITLAIKTELGQLAAKAFVPSKP